MGAKRQPVGARAVTLQARYCPRGEGGEAWCERTAEGRFGVRGKYLAKSWQVVASSDVLWCSVQQRATD